MYKDKKIAAIIPARKGSKGIPNKNIKELLGIPLIEYTIIQAIDSKFIDKIIVSSDSEEVLNIARKYGLDINGLRPEKLSSDTAIIYDVVKYELENQNLLGNSYDILVLLQPTSPLRPNHMIDNAIKNFINEKQRSAVGVSIVSEHPIYMRTIDQSGHLQRLLNIDSTIRRQDLPKYYKVNGMIYINWIHDIISNYISFNDNLYPIIIPNLYDIDIDNINDFEEAEKRLTIIEQKGNPSVE